MPPPARMVDGDDLPFTSATEVVASVLAGRLRAVDVVDAHLERIDAINDEVNAITRVNDGARDEAAAVDRAVAAGETLPLAGVTVTIKDNVDVAGQATPNGLAALANEKADSDAPLVEHLRAAGAVILGRTNTPEFSWRWHTENPHFGATLNPLDATLTPGGSSGGAAAALAAGIGCLAQGNDAGGSIRWPANCTGVSGLRPTIGRIASHNETAPAERPVGIDLAAVQGPLARSVDDLRLMFDTMVAPSWRDPSWVPAPGPSSGSGHRRRIGWCLGAGPEPHPEVVAAVEVACEALRSDGWTVEPIEVPDLADAARGWAALINTDFWVTGSRDTMLELGSPMIANMVELFDRLAEPLLESAGLYALLAERTAQVRLWQRLLIETVDAVVMPVSMEPAWPAGDDATSLERLAVIAAANTPLVAMNFLGLPAVAQPTGFTGGRPNGVQVVAARFAEHTALDAAASIERHLDGR
ncbi:MAG: amidase [Acidimicrobiales bacterium]